MIVIALIFKICRPFLTTTFSELSAQDASVLISSLRLRLRGLKQEEQSQSSTQED